MISSKEELINSDVIPSCKPHVEKIRSFINKHDNELVDQDLQEEISRLVVLLQKIEKLVIKTGLTKTKSVKKRLCELNILIEFLQLALESLFQKVPNRELAKRIRIDIERVVTKYERPITGVFINRFMDLYRSQSIPLRIVAGLAFSSSVATAFILASLLAFYLRPASEIDRQISKQELLVNNLREAIVQEKLRDSTLNQEQPPVSEESTENLTTLAVQLGLRLDDPRLIDLKTQTNVLTVLKQQQDLAQADSNLILLTILVFSSGTLGSVVSILIRIHQFDTKESEFTNYTDPLLPIFMGAFKPIIGSAFGLLFFALINSGIITVQSISDRTGRNREFFFCAIAFIVGFSERLASDVIRRAEDTIGGVQSVSPPESTAELVNNLKNSVESLTAHLTALESPQEDGNEDDTAQSSQIVLAKAPVGNSDVDSITQKNS